MRWKIAIAIGASLHTVASAQDHRPINGKVQQDHVQAEFISAPVTGMHGQLDGQVDLILFGNTVHVVGFRDKSELRSSDGTMSSNGKSLTPSLGAESGGMTVESTTGFEDDYMKIVQVTINYPDGSSETVLVIYNKVNGQVETLDPTER